MTAVGATAGRYASKAARLKAAATNAFRRAEGHAAKDPHLTSVKLFAVQPLVAANAGDEVPAGSSVEAARRPRGDVAEVGIIRGRSVIGVNRGQFGAAAERKMPGIIDDPRERGRRHAGPAEDHPPLQPLAAGAVVNRDA